MAQPSHWWLSYGRVTLFLIWPVVHMHMLVIVRVRARAHTHTTYIHACAKQSSVPRPVFVTHQLVTTVIQTHQLVTLMIKLFCFICLKYGQGSHMGRAAKQGFLCSQFVLCVDVVLCADSLLMCLCW